MDVGFGGGEGARVFFSFGGLVAMMTRLVPLVAVLLVSGCALNTRQTLSQREMAALWQEPADLQQRNLFYGPGGRALLPDATASYDLLEVDKNGFSPGYDVRDANGAHVERQARSRIANRGRRRAAAVGGRVPPAGHLLLPRWTSTRTAGRLSSRAGRFRLKPASRGERRRVVLARQPLHRHPPLRGSVRVHGDGQQLGPQRPRRTSSIAFSRTATIRATCTS